MDFRCPAQCLDAILQNPRTVGNIQAVYVPLIVGGGDLNKTYRGDSFICPAAIQAYCFPIWLHLNTANYLIFKEASSPANMVVVAVYGYLIILPISFHTLRTVSPRSDFRPSFLFHSVLANQLS